MKFPFRRPSQVEGDFGERLDSLIASRKDLGLFPSPVDERKHAELLLRFGYKTAKQILEMTPTDFEEFVASSHGKQWPAGHVQIWKRIVFGRAEIEMARGAVTAQRKNRDKKRNIDASLTEVEDAQAALKKKKSEEEEEEGAEGDDGPSPDPPSAKQWVEKVLLKHGETKFVNFVMPVYLYIGSIVPHILQQQQ